MIDLMPNQTFFYQLGIFLVAFIGLNFLVFQPVLRIIAKRKSLTEESVAEAEKIQQESQKLVGQYQEKIQWARGQGVSLKENLRKEGERQSRELLQQTRGELEKNLEAARQELATQTTQAEQSLRGTGEQLASEIAEKLLGRKVAS